MEGKDFLLLLIGLAAILAFIFSIGGNTDIDTTYNKTLYTIEDLRFPASDLTLGAVNDPSPVVFISGLKGLSFSGTKLNELFLEAQMSHLRVPSSNLSLHFHWSTNANTTAGNYITWCAEYSCSNIGEQFINSTTKCINQTQTLGDRYKHYITDMIEVSNNFTASAMCSIRIYRDGANDNSTNDVILLEFDMHYIINSTLT